MAEEKIIDKNSPELAGLKAGVKSLPFREGVKVFERDAVVIETNKPNENIVVALAKTTGKIVVMWNGALNSQTLTDPEVAIKVVESVARRKQLLEPAA